MTETSSPTTETPGEPARLSACAVMAIMTLAVGLRLLAVFTDYGLDNDGYINVSNARHLAAGRIDRIDPRNPPLYPAMLAVGSRLGLPAAGFGKGLNVVAGALGSVGCALLALEVTRRHTVAVVAGLCYAVIPGLAARAGRVVTEPVHIGLVAWMLFAALRGTKRRSLRWIVVSAVLLALVAMCRYEGIAYGLAVVFVVVAGNGWHVWKHALWKIVAAAIITVIGFAGLVPSSLIMHRTRGTWMPLPPPAVQVVKDTGQQTVDQTVPEGTVPDYRKQHMARYRKMAEVLFLKALPQATFYGAYLLPALVGVGILAVRRRWTWLHTGLLFFCLWRVAVLFLWAGISDRYLYPLYPALLTWAAVGLVGVSGPFGRARVWVLAMMLAALAAGGTFKAARPTNVSDIRRREASRMVVEDAREQGIEQLTIASFVPQYAYYADARWYELFRYDDILRRDLDELSERIALGLAGFQYMVIERWNAPENAPGFEQKIDHAPLVLVDTIPVPEQRDAVRKQMDRLRRAGEHVTFTLDERARIDVYRVVRMHQVPDPVDPAAP